MKSCPVCKAQAFDDAEVCYGCLYRFEWSNANACPYHTRDDSEECWSHDDMFAVDEPEPFYLKSLKQKENDTVMCEQPVASLSACTAVLSSNQHIDSVPISLPATVVIQLHIQQAASAAAAPINNG